VQSCHPVLKGLSAFQLQEGKAGGGGHIVCSRCARARSKAGRHKMDGPQRRCRMDAPPPPLKEASAPPPPLPPNRRLVAMRRDEAAQQRRRTTRASTLPTEECFRPFKLPPPPVLHAPHPEPPLRRQNRRGGPQRRPSTPREEPCGHAESC
jgi:hypothetical protein